jgi:hypothetical protein
MNRIIACAFKNTDIQNIISVVKRERPLQKNNAEESGGIVDETDEDRKG